VSICGGVDDTGSSANPGHVFLRLLALTIFISCVCTSASSMEADETLTIAVASNFKNTLERLADSFRPEGTVNIRIVSASTGVLFAQIASGAPFDLFLAADVSRPERLAQDHLGLAETRFTYALGQLVLWIHGQKEVSAASLTNLGGKFSIANPDTAPYGFAARQYLQRIGRWQSLKDQMVFAKNITQAFQYVSSGNAQAGLIAWSVLMEHRESSGFPTDFWIVPVDDYSPIEQQAIRLVNAQNPNLADEFSKFLKTDSARGIIKSSGYSVPTRTDTQ
jgi:molybdate transport system substrate-binding protein